MKIHYISTNSQSIKCVLSVCFCNKIVFHANIAYVFSISIQHTKKTLPLNQTVSVSIKFLCKFGFTTIGRQNSFH